MSSGSAVLLLGLGVRSAVRVVRVAAAGATTVELDAVAGAGNAIAFAGAAAGRVRGHAGWGRAVGAARAGQGGHIRVGVRVDVGVVLVDVGTAKAGGELIDGGLGVALGADAGGLDWVVWLWALDVLTGDTTADGDLLGGAAGGALGRGGLGAAGWDIEDVELALGGWLEDGLLGWVMGAVVAIHDILSHVYVSTCHSHTPSTLHAG